MKDFHRFRPHPWHGLGIGDGAPSKVNAFIEITNFDLVKYEVDKNSGYLRVDRPNRTSSLPPTLYGFVPQTLCADRVRALMPDSEAGDNDPLDICVISERPITRAEVILTARVVGGLPMLDGGEADDKIIAVLENDHVYEKVTDIGDLPGQIVERLRHYFLSYKTLPGEEEVVSLGAPYGRSHAMKVITAAVNDYREAFPPEFSQ
ncbi:MAG: inorganic pyrophosphatase [Gammaproteobacteria bacterium]